MLLDNRKPELKPLEIEVTQEDINGATKGSMHQCAIARAITRTYGGSWGVVVNGIFGVLIMDGTAAAKKYDLGPEGQLFVNSFDRGMKMAPTRLAFQPMADPWFCQVTVS